MLAEKDFEYIECNWNSVPLPALANKFGISALDLMPPLRGSWQNCCTRYDPRIPGIKRSPWSKRLIDGDPPPVTVF